MFTVAFCLLVLFSRCITSVEKERGGLFLSIELISNYVVSVMRTFLFLLVLKIFTVFLVALLGPSI